jgi:hypothetical protein
MSQHWWFSLVMIETVSIASSAPVESSATSLGAMPSTSSFRERPHSVMSPFDSTLHPASTASVEAARMRTVRAAQLIISRT